MIYTLVSAWILLALMIRILSKNNKEIHINSLVAFWSCIICTNIWIAALIIKG